MLIPRDKVRARDLDGLRVSDYGALRGGTASASVVEVPARAESPYMRSSHSDKLFFMLEGRVRFSVDGVIYGACAGDLVFIRKGLLFWYWNHEGEASRMLLVHVPAYDPEGEHVLPDELRTHAVHLSGERVTLRPMTEHDWEWVLAWNADLEVLIWSDDTEEPRAEEEIKDIYRSVSQFAHVFIIELEGEPIGECWLQKMNLARIIERFPEKDLRRIDIMIGRKDLWGQGLGRETIRALVEFGFEQEGADGIFAQVRPNNVRSWRAFEKAGFDESAGFEKFTEGGERWLVVWREGRPEDG